MILFITMVVLFIKNTISGFKNRKQLRLKLYWPVLIYAATFLGSFIIPADIFESRTILVACHNGTQNQARIKFKQDKTFEMNCSGVFGYNEWFTGNYKQKGDTLYLKYNQLKPRTFGEIILNHNGELISLGKSKDSLFRATFTIEKN
jgi:hypothetical protein